MRGSPRLGPSFFGKVTHHLDKGVAYMEAFGPPLILLTPKPADTQHPPAIADTGGGAAVGSGSSTAPGPPPLNATATPELLAQPQGFLVALRLRAATTGPVCIADTLMQPALKTKGNANGWERVSFCEAPPDRVPDRACGGPGRWPSCSPLLASVKAQALLTD